MSGFFDRPWDGQPPPDVGLDRSHPLASRVILQYQSGSIDTAGGITPTRTAISTGTIALRGVGFVADSYNGTTSVVSFGDPSSVDFGSELYSIECIASLGTAGTNQSIFEKDNESTQRQLFLQSTGSSQIRFGFGNNAGGFTLFDTSASAVTNGVPFHVLGCRTGSSTLAVYINGVLQSGSYALQTATTVASTSADLRIGLRANGALPITSGSKVALARIYRGDMSAYARTLADNPWQLFEPRRIMMPVTAAVGGTFKAAWAMRKARTIGAGAI